VTSVVKFGDLGARPRPWLRVVRARRVRCVAHVVGQMSDGPILRWSDLLLSAELLYVRALCGAVTKLSCVRVSCMGRRKTDDRLLVQTTAQDARTPFAGASTPSICESFQLRWRLSPPLLFWWVGVQTKPSVGGGGLPAHRKVGCGAGSALAHPTRPAIVCAIGVGLRPRLRSVQASASTERVA
jgi:hypothetical protein